MRFTKRILFLVLFMRICPGHAQVVSYGHHCGAKADAGISLLRWQPGPFSFETQNKTLSSFSWRAGLSYSYRFKNFLGLGVDILYTNIAGRQVATGTWPNTGIAFTYTGYEQLPYISIPFYLTAHCKKFSLSLGGDYMRYLGGTIKGHISDAAGSTWDYSVYSTMILPADFGLYGSLAYRFHQRFAATLNFYYSWIDISRQGPAFDIGGLKIMQITAGLAYHFYLKESSSKQKATSVRDMD